MTNSEKAREIELNVYAFGEKPKGEFQAPAYRAALEMAKWKDQQFKEYLEKNMTNYPDYMNGTDPYAFGMKEGYVVAFNKINDELFKED